MDKISYIKYQIGHLIKLTRAANMDQIELALRSGVSKNTISRMENGNSVNSESLFAVLERLDLLDPIIEAVEEQHSLVKKNPQRNRGKVEKELSNDF